MREAKRGRRGIATPGWDNAVENIGDLEINERRREGSIMVIT